MEICVKNVFDIHISPFFLVLITILSYVLLLPMSQLQTQHVMTSQIRSHIKYLIQTYNILVLLLYSKVKTDEKFSRTGGF